MNPYSLLVLGHILGAMVWLGGLVTLNLMATRARAGTSPAARVDFATSLAYVGPRALVPAVIAVILFGTWMVLASEAWDFSQPWIVAGIGLFIAALLVGGLYLGRIGIQLSRAAQSAAPDGEIGALLGRWILGSRLVLLVVFLAVCDMVLKPGL